MRNTLALCVLLGSITACQSPQPERSAGNGTTPAAAATAAPAASAVAAPDTAQARQWLITSIEDNFSKEDQEQQNIERGNSASIYTSQYLDYKLDAIQLEYQGEEEEKAFQKKWAGRYDTRYAGTGSFLFSGQDYGTVRVTRCQFKELTPDQALVFAVTTHDSTYQVDGQGDIKVIKTAQGYKIDDVREY